jgi:hypothetical protein
MIKPPHPKEQVMPNGVYPVPRFRPTSQPKRPTRPPLGLRVRTRWQRDRLDEALASGADPASTPELALRAEQLLSQAGRSRLADAIVELLGDAYGPNLGPYTAAGHERNARIRDYADNLRALVARLREERPIDVQGAAMTARLVHDRTGPLYRDGGAGLGSVVLSIRLALDPSGSGSREMPRAA